MFALIDLGFIFVLARRIKPNEFSSLRKPIILSSFIVWFAIWLIMSIFYWESVYSFVFPEWARWVIPPVYGLLFATINILLSWLSVSIKGNPVLLFCLLGGLFGPITHIWAISRGILEKPPMLQGVSPTAAVVMPFFEFLFYWCVILSLSKFFNDIIKKI